MLQREHLWRHDSAAAAPVALHDRLSMGGGRQGGTHESQLLTECRRHFLQCLYTGNYYCEDPLVLIREFPSPPRPKAVARVKIASNISGVTRPVKVFCWLGW